MIATSKLFRRPGNRLAGVAAALVLALGPLAAAPRGRDWFYRQRASPGQSIPAGARIEALRQLDAMPRDNSGASWSMIGPQPTNTSPDLGSGSPLASGRVTSLAVDPRRPDTVYLGAAQGGAWKTTDAGRHWLPLTDDQVSLAIGSLAIDPSQPDVVYAGTGEENFSTDSYYGAGILKSTDGGAT